VTGAAVMSVILYVYQTDATGFYPHCKDARTPDGKLHGALVVGSAPMIMVYTPSRPSAPGRPPTTSNRSTSTSMSSSLDNV
jgi:hypothetical protein